MKNTYENFLAASVHVGLLQCRETQSGFILCVLRASAVNFQRKNHIQCARFLQIAW